MIKRGLAYDSGKYPLPGGEKGGTRMSVATSEKTRLKHLYELELLDTPSEPAYDAFTNLAASICGTPISLITLVDENRQWFKSNYGLDGVTETARNVAFCNHAIQGQGIFEIPDARADERFANNPLVTGPPDIQYYAGVPIRVGAGHAIGTLCVIDRVARVLTDRQREDLTLLATAVTGMINSRVSGKLLQHYESAVRAEKQKLEITLATLGDAVITTDADGTVEFLNTAAERLLRQPSGLLIGRLLADNLDIESIERQTSINILTESRELAKNRALLRPKDGPQIFVEYQVSNLRNATNEITGRVVTMRDVSEEQKYTEKLSHEASHDKLTELYNRRRFEQCLGKAIVSAKKENRVHTLTYLDLDRFKPINDTYGHAAGDFYLTELARQLRKTLRGNDVLARIGGDEFGFIMHDCKLDNAKPVLQALEKTVQMLKVPWQGATLSVGVSYGTVEVDRDTISVFAAMSEADRLCYEAKAAATA